MINDIVKQTRRFLIFTLGGSFLIIALILIPLPGPGIFLTILALAFLATEFIWAQRLLRRLKGEASSLKGKVDGTHFGRKFKNTYLGKKIDHLLRHEHSDENKEDKKRKLDND